jgi:hypothetical protein
VQSSRNLSTFRRSVSSFRFLLIAWITLWHWRWRHFFLPKLRLTFNRLYGVTSQKISAVHLAGWLDIDSHESWRLRTEHNRSVSHTGVTLTDLLMRWSPNEWPSVCREIPVFTDKMLWTSDEPAQWTPYISHRFDSYSRLHLLFLIYLFLYLF